MAASGRSHAMMDISDGLASDLSRLCAASGVGAKVRAKDLPIREDARELAQEKGADPLDWALSGGEDFELLFTCGPEEVKATAGAVAAAEPGLGVTQVGSVGTGLTACALYARTRYGKGHHHGGI